MSDTIDPNSFFANVPCASRRKPITSRAQGENLVSLVLQSHARHAPERRCLNANTENMILLSDILLAFLQNVKFVPLVVQRIIPTERQCQTEIQSRR